MLAEGNQMTKSKLIAIVGISAGVIAAILFMLLEGFHGQMVLFTKNTPLFALIVVVSISSLVFHFKRPKQ